MKRLPKQWQPHPRLAAWLEKLPWLILSLAWLAASARWGWNLSQLEAFDAYLWKVAGTAAVVIALLGLAVSLISPMAYCRYGCPTGAVFKLLRYAGDEDRWQRRDWIALAMICLGALC
jgi:polyferredoxin